MTYHVLKASQDCSGDDAQEEGDDVEDGGRPEQMVEVHNILAALHLRVLVITSSQLHITAQGGERGRHRGKGQRAGEVRSAETHRQHPLANPQSALSC